MKPGNRPSCNPVEQTVIGTVDYRRYKAKLRHCWYTSGRFEWTWDHQRTPEIEESADHGHEDPSNEKGKSQEEKTPFTWITPGRERPVENQEKHEQRINPGHETRAAYDQQRYVARYILRANDCINAMSKIRRRHTWTERPETTDVSAEPYTRKRGDGIISSEACVQAVTGLKREEETWNRQRFICADLASAERETPRPLTSGIQTDWRVWQSQETGDRNDHETGREEGWENQRNC